MENQARSSVPDSRVAEAIERNRFLATSALRSAFGLQAQLDIDEANYTGRVGYAHHAPRAFFIYGILDEVVKASMAALRGLRAVQRAFTEQKQRQAPAEHDRHVDRLVTESIRDECQLWVRKLREILAELVMFRTTNDPAYYRLYLLCRQLDAYVALQRDFDDFFDCKNNNVGNTIQQLVQYGKAILGGIGANPVWFLRKEVKLERPPSPGFFASAREKFVAALGFASMDERIALGPSYDPSFSMPSRSIHPNVGGPTLEMEAEGVAGEYSLLAILAIHITLVAHRLAGVELGVVATDLANALAKSPGERAFQDKHCRQHQVGDIVLAYGNDMCQVMEAVRSKFGYTAFRVRYLGVPPLPGITEDWFQSQYVHLILSKASYRVRLIDMYRDAGCGEDELSRLNAMPDDEWDRLFLDGVAQMAKSGDMQTMLDSFAALRRRPKA